MSLSRIAAFVIGLILAVFGLFTTIQSAFDWIHMLVGLGLLIIGIWIMLGLPLTI